MITNGDNGLVMPVTPMGGYGYGSGGGLCGDWGSWIILFLIFGMFGFGGNGFGGNGNQGANPWLLAASQRTDDGVQAGFNQAAITGQLSGIQASIADLGNIGYQNQIADMNQRFSDATALNTQLSNLAMGLQNCCCNTQSAIADVKYSVATEGCADRNALNVGVRDLITNSTANTQSVLDAIRGINDKLCDQELQAERRENDSLRQQLAMAQLAASQSAQTSAIEQYVRPNPSPAYIVANPYCNYNQSYGCGCGA